MKYVIIIPDGCSDEPQEVINGRTPLAAANTPAMDAVAARGVVGRACHTPLSLPAGSDVANMSVLGYDPLKLYAGRAPLEAAAQGIDLGPEDWAIRCNLVTIEHQTMNDFTAGHISNEEAAALMQAMQEALGDDHLEFIPGVSYRNLILYRGHGAKAPFGNDLMTAAPHDLLDKSVLDEYPRGPGGNVLCDLMSRSVEIFADHPVNRNRVAKSLPPATCVWLWGLGQKPNLTPFEQLHKKKGAMITAVDLLRGLASIIGWDIINVPGATGYIDTDYAAKGLAAVEALKDHDLVFVHVEATDEASHEGDLGKKISALEEIDRHIVAPVLESLGDCADARILVTPDHPTLLSTRTHSHGTVPFAMAGAGIEADDFLKYDESNSRASSLAFDQGCLLMPHFLGEEK